MAEPSIDTLGWWPMPYGLPVLPTVKPEIIPKGGSMAFVFPSPTPSAEWEPSVWVCTVHVVEHRGGPDIITPKVIVQDATGLYSGYITTTETATLTDRYYFLVAIFTSIDKEIQMATRFQVRTPWIVNP
jgi:hypothetical protein